MDEDQQHPLLDCRTETSPVLIPVKPKTWQEWVLGHQEAHAVQRRSTGKRRAVVHPGQLSIWGVGKEEERTKDQSIKHLSTAFRRRHLKHSGSSLALDRHLRQIFQLYPRAGILAHIGISKEMSQNKPGECRQATAQAAGDNFPV